MRPRCEIDCLAIPAHIHVKQHCSAHPHICYSDFIDLVDLCTAASALASAVSSALASALASTVASAFAVLVFLYSTVQ